MMARLRYLLRALYSRRGFEQDIDDELAFHLQSRAAELQTGGMDPGHAQRQARIELGMLNRHRDEMRAAAGLRQLDWLASDLRLAWRSLRRAPLYSTVAVLVLALPLAAGLLLHALYGAYAAQSPALDRPERWVHVYAVTASNPHLNRFTAAQAEALRAQPPAELEGLYSTRLLNLPIVGDRIQRGIGVAVSDDFFPLTGVPALRGRLLHQSDPDESGIVLSERGWSRLFDRDETVIGRVLNIGGHDFRVLGVAGRDFRGTDEVAAHYWMLETQANRHWPSAVGVQDRYLSGFIRPGATLPALGLALSARLDDALANEAPAQPILRVAVEAAEGYLRGDDRQALRVALLPASILIGLMLLIAAANLTNLVLARFAGRRHDLALRSALGASRWRCFAQLITECTLLGLLAAGLALLLLALALRPLHGWLFGALANLGLDPISLGLNWTSLALAFLLGLLATAAFGALPAWLISRGAVQADSQGMQRALKQRGGQRLQAVLMVLQVACSVFLMVVAAMIGGVSRQANEAPLGFDPQPIISIDAGERPEQRRQHMLQLSIVQAATATSGTPLMGQQPEILAGSGPAEGRMRLRWIDPHWFTVMNQSALAGRGMAPGDGDTGQVALLSRSAALQAWPLGHALGQTLQLHSGETAFGANEAADVPAQVQIAGIVPDLGDGLLITGTIRPTLYLPAAADDPHLDTLLLRLSDTSPAALAEVYRHCVGDGDDAGCQPLRLTEALDLQRLPLRMAGALTGSLAWTGLLICCIGLQGLVTYTVQQRRREIGIQLALGATPQRVVRHVLSGALRQIVGGLALGLPLAWLLSAVIAHATAIVGSSDARSLLGTPLVLALVAILAAWWPARRAARVAPSVVLRQDA